MNKLKYAFIALVFVLLAFFAVTAAQACTSTGCGHVDRQPRDKGEDTSPNDGDEKRERSDQPVVEKKEKDCLDNEGDKDHDSDDESPTDGDKDDDVEEPTVEVTVISNEPNDDSDNDNDEDDNDEDDEDDDDNELTDEEKEEILGAMTELPRTGGSPITLMIGLVTTLTGIALRKRC